MTTPAVPVLTIVTICRNDAVGLARTLDSVRAQTVPPGSVEVEVVDGASSDGTADVPALYAADLAIRVTSEPDRGVYDAMNKGWRRARGRWIGFLNAGDTLADPQVLADLVERLSGTAEQWLVGRTVFVDERGDQTGVSDNVPHQRWNHFLGRRMHAHPSTFMRRELLEELAGFSLDFGFAGDFELVVRAGERYPAGSYERVIAHFVEGGLSTQLAAQTPELLHRVRASRLRRRRGPAALLEGAYSKVYARRYAAALARLRT